MCFYTHKTLTQPTFRFKASGDPFRKFYYILPSTFIKRWTSCPRWCSLLQYRHHPSQDNFNDILDGRYMEKILGRGFTQAENGLFVAWALGADGVVAREMDSYSVTPIFLTCLMFSPDFRYSWEALVCVGIVPGPGHNTLEPFMRVILEDIASPLRMYDSIRQDFVWCHQSLAIIWADTQGLSDVTCGNSPGAYAVCHQCHIIGVFHAAAGLACMSYPGEWRHLPAEEFELRQLGFRLSVPGLDARVGDHHPPLRTKKAIRRAQRLADRSHVQSNNSNHPSKRHYFHSSSYISRILGAAWHTGTQIVADWAHEAQNFGKMMVFSFFGVECGAMNPGRIDLEVQRGLFSRDVLSIKPYPWMLTLQEAAAFNSLLTSRRIPNRHGGRSRPLVPGCVGRIKMAEWAALLGPVIVYCLQFTKCFSRFPVYREFWSRYVMWWFRTNRATFPRNEIAKMKKEHAKLATLREILLPSTCNSTTNHYEQHIMDNLENWGPPRFSSMFRDERANGFITGCPVSGRGDMEKTMMSRYVTVFFFTHLHHGKYELNVTGLPGVNSAVSYVCLAPTSSPGLLFFDFCLFGLDGIYIYIYI